MSCSSPGALDEADLRGRLVQLLPVVEEHHGDTFLHALFKHVSSLLLVLFLLLCSLVVVLLLSGGKLRGDTVSFHNFKSQNFKLSVSNLKSKYVAYVSILSQISNCQSLGRKSKHEILKTDRTKAT